MYNRTQVYTVHIYIYIHIHIFMYVHYHVCVWYYMYGYSLVSVSVSNSFKRIPESPSTGVTYIEYKLVVPTCTGSSSLQYLYPVPVICNTCTSNGAVQEGNVCLLFVKLLSAY